MTFRALAILGLIALGKGLSGEEAPAPADWRVDYTRWPDGHAYTKAEASADWPALAWFAEPAQARIAEFPAGSKRRWLRVDFPKDTFGNQHGIFYAANLAPSDRCTVEYDVHFPEGWEFSRGQIGTHGGGKLPGLSGGSHPSGGLGKPDGLSARPMWRRDTRFSAEPQNYLELYLYWREQTEKYGDRFFAQVVEAGKTYRIKLTVELGTPERDGRVRLWIDGTLRLEKSFRFLAPGQDWKLTQYMHNAFYGGNDAGWAPTRDQYLLLGPVHVSTSAGD